MKSLIVVAVMLFLTHPAVATLQENQMMISTDLSYTTARELWKGKDDEISYQDAEGDTHPDGTVKDGKTQFTNLGLEFSYGTPVWGIQSDLRIDYTSSRMRGATHPNAKNGKEDDGVDQLSGIAVKFLKDMFSSDSLTLTPYIGYKHPVEDEPEVPTFIAVNDFSHHYNLGLKTAFSLTPHFYTFFDAKYTMRSKDSKLKDDQLPADQATGKLDFLYAYDASLSFGGGLVYQHTMAGPDISTPRFGANAKEAGHPPFYAARERFLATVAYFNYYLSPESWMGVSQFEKVWGRNTDRSRTFTLFMGRMI